MKNRYRGGAATPKSPAKNCKYIIPDKELNYIDTLYLYANAEELIEEDKIDVIDAYNEVCRTILFEKYPDSEQTGYANNRRWFDTPNFRIGVMDYELAKKLNQYTLEIQYKHHHLWQLNNDVSRLELPFDSDLSNYKIKRVDVTKTAILNVDYTKDHGFITKFRDDGLNPKRVGDSALTVYFGSRGVCTLRIYSKTDELMSKLDYAKIERYRSYFDTVDNLYTFEYEFHRKYLTKNYNIDSLKDFYNILKLGAMKFGEIGIFKINDKNIRNYKNKHYDRIDVYCFNNTEFLQRSDIKEYKPSLTYLIRRLEKLINSFIMRSNKKISKSEILLNLFPDELELIRVNSLTHNDIEDLISDRDLYLIKIVD